VEILRATEVGQVPSVLRRVDEASRSGAWAVGFVAYEAAGAFDPAFRTLPPAGDPPLAWFGLFEGPRAWEATPGSVTVSDVVPTVTDTEYLEAVARIRRLIARGETYQANLTYRLRGTLQGPGPDAAALFLRLVSEQPSPYATYLDLGGTLRGDLAGPHAVCSASPELFFHRTGRSIVCRPMKGTIGRGRTTAEDRAAARVLAESSKERAENLMIVDMVRNDLGRIARTGSVRVPDLFRIERYPTLFQMTSEVAAETDATLEEVFAALFPCASITGAPKVRTMEILAELETTPRGVYTGAVGFVAPGGDARFSVAIRTAWVGGEGASAARGARVEYGTGSGVVWDSKPRSELAETRTKALILTGGPHRGPSAGLGPGMDPGMEPDTEPGTEPGDGFRLLETLRWEPDRPGTPGLPSLPLRGYSLLERHLERLADSADYFGFTLDPDAVRAELARIAAELASAADGGTGGAWRVRLLVDRSGSATAEAGPLSDPLGGRGGGVDGGGGDGPERRAWRVELAASPVDASDRFLFHKTTRREVYERARREVPEADDAILWNRDGELTETTIANLVVELDGDLLTPRVSSGLLPGTRRAELLERDVIREARLLREDLGRAHRLWLINSVRGWIPARLLRAKTRIDGAPAHHEIRSPAR
jgi:para-aminobenzoate synthetase/4-amino-4-deoxychorismate lyase